MVFIRSKKASFCQLKWQYPILCDQVGISFIDLDSYNYRSVNNFASLLVQASHFTNMEAGPEKVRQFIQNPQSQSVPELDWKP